MKRSWASPAGKTAILLAIPALCACQLVGNLPNAPMVPPLIGTVDFGSTPRQVQSTEADVAYAATVSLIDISTTSASPTQPLNRTVATSLTDSQYRFQLTFSNFRPDATSSYLLEAVKGLQSNAVSVSAARLRTIIRFNAGWITMTNLVPNAGIVVGAPSTALSIIQGARTDVPASSLMGTLTVSGSTTTYLQGAGDPVTDTEYNSVLPLVTQALAADNDPLGTIVRNSGTGVYSIAVSKAPIVNGFTPSSGGVGTQVTLSGAQFDPTPANDVVKFNGVQATVVSATSTQLVVTVPTTTTGLLTVANTFGTTTAGTFTVIPTIGGQFPAN